MDVLLQPRKEVYLKTVRSITNEERSCMIDLQTGLVFQGNEHQSRKIVFKLGRRDVAVLHMLVSYNGLPVSRAQLLDEIWHDRVVTDNVLTVSISNIRKALKFLIPSGDDFIVTVNGIGYFVDVQKNGLIVFCDHEEKNSMQ